MRESILTKERKSKLKITRNFMKFLDADESYAIFPRDADTRLRASDLNADAGLSVAEWDKAIGNTVNEMCGGLARVDRVKWERNSKQKKTTKKDLFTLIDRDGDLNVTKLELTAWYEDMNGDKDPLLVTEEILGWVNKNLDSVCNEARQAIDEEWAQKDRAEAINSKAVNDLLIKLNMNFDVDVNVNKEDSAGLLTMLVG